MIGGKKEREKSKSLTPSANIFIKYPRAETVAPSLIPYKVFFLLPRIPFHFSLLARKIKQKRKTFALVPIS